MSRAFEGIRVADFSQVLSGPYLTAQLAFEGAEIIKVEPPGIGDQMRNRLIPSPLTERNMASAFLALNHGKRSVALDLKNEDDRRMAEELVMQSDVLVQNFRGGVAERLGLGWETWREKHPKLIYCHITGFGATGPRKSQGAYDGAIQAASGMMATNGHPSTGPTRTGYFPVDLFTGMTGAYAVAAALFRRERTGKGQYIDLSMLDSALNIQAPSIAQWLVDGFENTLIGNASATYLPTADSFPCSDGSVLMSATMQNHAEALLKELGLGALLDDERFATSKARIANRVELRERMVAAFAADTAESWAARLGEKGVPISAIKSIPDVVREPQLEHRGTIVSVDMPDISDQPVRLVGPAYHCAEDSPGVTRPPPQLGEHTEEVLAEIRARSGGG